MLIKNDPISRLRTRGALSSPLRHHVLETVLVDLTGSLRLLAPGGLIVCDDVQHRGVRDAINQLQCESPGGSPVLQKVRFCLSACLPACLSACLPACLPACLSVCLSV